MGERAPARLSPDGALLGAIVGMAGMCAGDGSVTVGIEARDDDEVRTAGRAFRSTSAGGVRRDG
ncbi:hypothetical protein BH20ACT9_BH20ACT9_14940 [soil metagenome]